MEDQISCINGLIEAKVENALAKNPPANFDDWIMRVMGKGIADIFMRPYNFKVWAIPTSLVYMYLHSHESPRLIFHEYRCNVPGSERGLPPRMSLE